MNLTVSGIHFSYHGGREVLHGVSLCAASGELVSIIGPNGCGKTTFIKCINRIHRPYKGSVSFDGVEIGGIKRGELAKIAGYVPQMSGGGIGVNVIDMLLIGRKPYITWRIKESDICGAIDVLKKLNMEELANVPYGNLSGGQKQKALFARALVQDPKMFILDEPTSFLDIKNQLEIMNIIHNIAKTQNKIVIMVLHDLNLAMRYSDKTALMYQGNIVSFDVPSAALTPRNIKDVYGVNIKIIDKKHIIIE
jgi:iron complex transport system ATP-binding protein